MGRPPVCAGFKLKPADGGLQEHQLRPSPPAIAIYRASSSSTRSPECAHQLEQFVARVCMGPSDLLISDR